MESGGKIEPLADLSFEDKQNLISFFELLIRVDKRINPDLYENNGSTNNAD